MRWFGEIQKKAKKVAKKYLVITKKVAPGEAVIGKLSTELLHLHGLTNQWTHELTRTIDEHNTEYHVGKSIRNPAVCEDFLASTRTRLNEIKTLREVFWLEVRAEFNLPGGPLELREGGQVVMLDQSPDEMVEELLSNIFRVEI